MNSERIAGNVINFTEEIKNVRLRNKKHISVEFSKDIEVISPIHDIGVEVGSKEYVFLPKVDVIITELMDIQNQVRAGVISEEAGKILSADVIRNAKYGETGYLWADDLQGNNIVLLGKKDTEGKNRLDLQDANGMKIIQRFIEMAKQSGEGYLDYYFPKPNETQPSPKGGYVKLYQPYGWVIGTGNYIDDIEKSIKARQAVEQEHIRSSGLTLAGIALLILFFGSFFAILFSRSISNPIIKASRDGS